MIIKSLIGFVGKREWTALGILAAAFAAFMVFQLNVWSFIAVSVLFIIYVYWTASAFFMTQQNYSGKRITALALPVGIALFQTLVCLGLVWLIVWSVRHAFGR
jgi:hypothetical protein